MTSRRLLWVVEYFDADTWLPSGLVYTKCQVGRGAIRDLRVSNKYKRLRLVAYVPRRGTR